MPSADCRYEGWTAAAGDVTAAFLNGDAVDRLLHLRQPKHGLPGLHPSQLIKMEKGVFGLGTVTSCTPSSTSCRACSRSKSRRSEQGICVSQSSCVENRLFEIEIDAGADNDQPANAEQLADNRSLVRALSWLASQTRPDLACGVSMAQQLQSAPMIGDLKFTNQMAR